MVRFLFAKTQIIFLESGLGTSTWCGNNSGPSSSIEVRRGLARKALCCTCLTGLGRLKSSMTGSTNSHHQIRYTVVMWLQCQTWTGGEAKERYTDRYGIRERNGRGDRMTAIAETNKLLPATLGSGWKQDLNGFRLCRMQKVGTKSITC